MTRAIPVVAFAAGAGTTSHVLGDVGRQATRYARTRFPAEEYGLPLPAGLVDELRAEDVDGGAA